MANPIVRILAAAVIPAILLSGCGRSIQPALPAIAKGNQAPAAAKGVSPDHEATLAGDIRRAKYWMGDAELVMAVHSTNFGTTAISASANVFYSKEAFLSGKTSVFVARHYGIRPIAQYTESPDYNRLAGRLAAIGKYEVKAVAAWAAAREAAKGKLALSSRAFLIQPEGATAEWHFYSGNQAMVIDGNTKAIKSSGLRANPQDRLNNDPEVELQRASIAWLPTNAGGSNIITEPQPTN